MRSIIDLFEKSCVEHADKPAYSNMGVTMDYKALDEKSRAFASYLQTELNMEKGDILLQATIMTIIHFI